MPERGPRLWGLSFLLALAAWLYIRFGNLLINPHDSEIQLTVPISVTGLAPGRKVRIEPEDAVVVLVGDARVDANVQALVDAAGRIPGVYRLPLQVVSANAVTSVEPANVVIAIRSEGT